LLDVSEEKGTLKIINSKEGKKKGGKNEEEIGQTGKEQEGGR
jgi:hypothetical protein